MPRLYTLQSLWGMSRLAPVDPPVESLVARIAAAGFDGVGLRCMDRYFVARAAPVLRAHGLVWQAQCLPRAAAELAPLLDIAAEHGALQVNVMACLPPAPAAHHAAILGEWQLQATARGLDLLIETHRGTATNGVAETLALLAALPGLRLTADLSHLVVGGGVKLAEAGVLAPILAASAALHLRIGTSEQVQVAVDWPVHAAWRDAFAAWWRTILRHRRGHDVVALVELGPPPFAITDAHGVELADRWADALALRELIRQIWRDERETPE